MTATGRQPRLLQHPDCAPLTARWSGDLLVDEALARPTARQAAARLFGPRRATRPVIRGLAGSLLGPPGQPPGRNAALFALSLLLALDPPPPDLDTDDVDGQPLAADDLAAVLAASGEADAAVRSRLLAFPVRDQLSILVERWPRDRRRDLALELVRDDTGRADELLHELRLASRASGLLFPATAFGLEGALAHVRLLAADGDPRLASHVLAGAAAFRDRPRIHLDDGYEVRVPTTPSHLAAEAALLSNCLPSRADAIEHQHHLVATVHRGRQPLAAVEVSAAGAIEQLLGPANRPLERREQELVEHLLLRAGVVDELTPDRPRGHAEHVAARIACRAAVLLTAERDPEPDPGSDPWVDPADGPGEPALRLLGGRASLLTDPELRTLRSPAAGAPRHDLDAEGWQVIGTMLVASHLDDPDLVRLDGGAVFRRAAREHARRILAGTLTLDERPPRPGLGPLRRDPDVPRGIREGLREVHEHWCRAHRRGGAGRAHLDR